MSKIFVDTNILAYAFDQHNAEKQRKSRAFIKKLEQSGEGVVSTQILQELFIVLTKKLKAQPLAAKQALQAFENFEIVMIDLFLVYDAIDCHLLNRISFWDALVVVAAEKTKCEKIWTEDLNNGQIIKGVLIENPMRTS